jgi:2-iminobutanoate/2-iminopropanoate deaminase
MIDKIHTEKAPRAATVYSQAIAVDNQKVSQTIYCSGQIALNPETGKLIEGGVKEQTKQALKNLQNILEAADCNFSNIVKCEIFLEDINDYQAVNEIYGEYFPEDYKPARVAYEVSKLPLGARVEIACIAVK